MASIRDLVDAVRRRDGVEAAIVLGRDGLLVDGDTVSYLDGEQVAAHSPAVFTAADALGKAARAGQLQTAVLEFPGTIAIISAMSEDALLVVLARPTAALPPPMPPIRSIGGRRGEAERAGAVWRAVAGWPVIARAGVAVVGSTARAVVARCHIVEEGAAFPEAGRVIGVMVYDIVYF